MDIPESVLKRDLMPKDYDRPRIVIGNYYLKWNDKSYGIPQKEVHELKRFITNAIPFFDTSYEFLYNFEKPRYKDKYRLYKELIPNVHISNTNKQSIVKFELHMHPDGSTFIDRIEGIEPTTTAAMVTPKNDNDHIIEQKVNTEQKYRFEPLLYLKWTLGELLFNRQGRI